MLLSWEFLDLMLFWGKALFIGGPGQFEFSILSAPIMIEFELHLLSGPKFPIPLSNSSFLALKVNMNESEFWFL